IGVDVGGTKIAAGLVFLPKGEVRARQQIPTAPARGGEAVFAEVRRLCEALMAKAKAQNENIDCIGVGVCELVDGEGNVLSENWSAWKGRAVQADLKERAPAAVEADVRAAALAEATVGAGKAFQQFLYITVGTGISCCLVLDGKPFTGAHSVTGTMASSPLSVPCEQCGHISRRTLEEVASGLGLVAHDNQRCSAQAETGQAILAAAAAGDAVAADVVRCGGETLGASVGLLIDVLDPEAVIVGGGLGLSEGLFWESFV